jgi:prevent-host-death family protein
MLDRKPEAGSTTVGAYEAKTKFSELIARAEKGESFVVTKNGRPVARIAPIATFDREKARRAADEIRRLAASIPSIDLTWEELKAEIENDRDERVERWIKS